jgi:hypothetical protein
MTISAIRLAIYHAEQRARYYDAAEGRQWFAERVPRERNEAELEGLREQLALASRGAN